jgi:hypothetical protein
VRSYLQPCSLPHQNNLAQLYNGNRCRFTMSQAGGDRINQLKECSRLFEAFSGMGTCLSSRYFHHIVWKILMNLWKCLFLASSRSL